MIKKFLILSLLFLPFLAQAENTPSSDKKESSPILVEQNDTIKAILSAEKDPTRYAKLAQLINQSDLIYADLAEKLKNGSKIIVFIDPAHGKLPSGRWQGEATARLSSRGLPEEIYSILLTRKLYKLLTDNKFIEVHTTPDFMEVLQEKSETYNNITFTETIKLAEECNSFFILSSHLNNVDTLQKADGVANISGIHVTRSGGGKLYLTDVHEVQKGFLTLYNKFDPTGFTSDIASGFRKEMVDYGYTPNNWDRGTVADDRFFYFAHFPLSLIFESAFISNPKEEEMLMNEKNQDEIAQSQYDAIIEAFPSRFGVDISGSQPKKEKISYDIVTLIKLSKIVNFYINEVELTKAINACSAIEKKYYGTKAENSIRSYSEIKDRLASARYAIDLAYKNLKKNRYNKACRSLVSADSALGKNPLYYQVRCNIASQYRKIAGRRLRRAINYGDAQNVDSEYDVNFQNLSSGDESHSLKTPFILTIDEGQSLKDAIALSIAPCEKYREKVEAALTNVKISGYVTQKKWSKKKKRFVNVKVRSTQNVSFSRGIYLIQFGSKFNVVRAEKVRRVPFDPQRYQNQQYFKNSSLADSSKEKSI